MKKLLIIRHAKSSWDVGTLSDFARPLNERGKRDAPAMAQRLVDKNINIDAFISSPAKRAKKTAEHFCSVYDKNEEEIIFIPELYHADPLTFYQTVQNIEDSFNTVALFSHNPGITEFINSLISTVKIDEMPTCGIFAIKAAINKWSEFKKATKEFLFFDYPKAL